MAQPSPNIELEEVWELVRRLSPRDKVRLIERIVPEIEQALALAPTTGSRPLLGLLADLGPAPTAEEIQAARTEGWSQFPRADI